jgi:hypothetical protein
MRPIRSAGVIAGALAAVALAAGPASAHHCYNAHAVEQGLQGMGSSQAFATFYEEALEFTGLCDAGIQVLADAAGVELWTPINEKATMASGSDGMSQGISYLDIDAIEAAVPDAIAACGG